MGKCYSMDLRERVVSYVGSGHSRRAAAVRFGVSPSFAVKLLWRQTATGSPAPARQGRPKGGGKLAPYQGFLIDQVEARPDVTMSELARLLASAHGVQAHPASLSRLLCDAGFSYKKNAAGFGVRTRGRPA
jgi:transposase